MQCCTTPFVLHIPHPTSSFIRDCSMSHHLQCSSALLVGEELCMMHFYNAEMDSFCCSGPGWPLLDTLWGRLFFVWTPESFHDYLALYPNLEGALCFVSAVDGNSGDSGGQTVTDPAGVFIQTYDSLSWSSPVTNSEIRSFTTRVSVNSKGAQSSAVEASLLKEWCSTAALLSQTAACHVGSISRWTLVDADT